nr:tenascin-R-like isoform X6 [Crassostrea gigas]
MSEISRDSSYEKVEAVEETNEYERHPDYVDLSDSTYDRIPDQHFDGQDYVELKNSHNEYTTPSDVQDYNLKDSLQYEKPIQVVRPFSQLQPPKQPNNFVPELFKNGTQYLHEISVEHTHVHNEKQNTYQTLEVDNTVLSSNERHSNKSKRPCIVGVALLLTILIASGMAIFLVFHFKEQENKSTMSTTSFFTSTIMTTMASSVLSSVTTTSLAQSTPISQTIAPTTLSKTEAVNTSTTTTTVIPTTVITTTLNLTTTTVIQTANPVTTVPTTELSTTPSPVTKTVIQTTNPASTISSAGVYKDCQELKINGYRNDGVYTIYPYLSIQSPVIVYCDMTTDNGGWTVFQHRRDGSVEFYLLWDDYKKGFGDPNGEYWLGNDHLHQLTSLGTSDLYVRLEKFTGGWAFARYNNFTVADESYGYRMRLKARSYQGNAGDSIESHGTTNTNGYKFSTSDIDNDFAPASCAVARQGAWWHNVCTWANLNGRYRNGSCIVSENCNFWYSLTNSYSGVKTSFMMVRRV